MPGTRKEASPNTSPPIAPAAPHNYPDGTPGTGWFVATTAAGYKVGILNLMGNVFMHPHLACPFAAAERALAAKPDDVKMVLVDLHAEVTSEKMAMGWYLDGRVSAVVGTHTHVRPRMSASCRAAPATSRCRHDRLL